MASRVTLVLVAVSAVAACTPPAAHDAPAFPGGTVIDLSHGFGAGTIFWPTAERFQLEIVADGMTDGGYYYAANRFSTAEHGGTHIDAPVHFAEGRQTVDRIPLEHLMGPAVVVDVTAAAAADRDYRITTADIEAWERAHGPIPAGAMLLFRTGFASRWPDAAAYLGTAERGDAAVADLHFPGLHPDAAQWIVDSRQVGAVGIDTASIDFGQSTAYESHRILFARDVPAFENLASLEGLPAAGAFVVALPMKIEGGSGAPLRVIAIVPEPVVR